MKRTSFLSLFLHLAVVLSLSAQTLRSDISLSDPFVMADPVSKQYYMTGTGGGLWRSPDLETWTYLGFPFQFNEAAWMGASPQVWASEIHRIDGRYYNLSTLTNRATTIDSDGHPRRAVHIMSSTLPEGKYTLITGGDATYVPAEKTTLDGTFFEDTDGRRYLVFCHEWIQNGNGTVEYLPLKPDMTGTEGEGQVMFRAKDAKWNTSPVTDGPYLFRTQTGRLGAIWTSWHGGRYVQGVAYSQSGTLSGPWTQEPLPITPDNYGHGMLFRTFDGQLLMSIHSHRTIDESKQKWERHPALFLMDDSGERLRTVMEYKVGIGPSNPTQVMVDNPEFEYGKQGWTITTGAQNQLIATNQSGAITGPFLESWDANSFTGEMFQEKTVPNGTYRVRAAAFRSSLITGGRQDAEVVHLFANGETTLVSSTSPQFYSVTVHVTDGRLRFGLRSDKKNFKWMGIDNVSVLYYGEARLTADEIDHAERNAAVYLRNRRDGKFLNAGQSWGTQAVMGEHPMDFRLVELPDGRYALDSQLDNGGGNHYAGANGYLDGSPAPFTIGQTEEGFVTLSTDGKHYWGSTGATLVSTSLTSPAGKGAQWEMLRYDDLCAALSEASADSPRDATFLIQCPNFGRNDNRIVHWQGEVVRGGDVKNQCAEAPSGKFDIHQTLTGIPNGIYRLSAQGFCQGGTARLYANQTTQALKDIADDTGTKPTTLDAASARFTAGRYANALTTEVTDGNLTLGIKKATTTQSWTVFDNFELYYLGPKGTDGIESISQPTQGSSGTRPGLAVYNLAGQCVGNTTANLAPGLYLIEKGHERRKAFIRR